MGRRIVAIIFILFIVIGGWYIWKHHQDEQALSTGDVHCVGCMSPEETDRFRKENAGETADGQSEHKSKTARQEAATDFQDAPAPAGSTTSTAPQATPTSTAPAPATAQPAPAPQPGFLQSAANAISSATTSSPPTTDSVSANPPNGARFAGTGTFQWYRQGNLTWRIDTATGRSCIIYATLEEWRKQIVLSHGCGRSA